jgi:hypothetical protein
VALLSDARRALLTATAPEEDSALAEAFAYVLNLGDESGLENLLGDIVANRNAIRRFTATAEQQGGVEKVLRKRLGLAAGETESRIATQYWPLPELSGGTLELYLSLADQKGGAKAQEVAYGLRLAGRERDDARRAEFLEKIFLTVKGEPKADSQFFVKAMLAEAPQLANAIAIARAHVAASRDRLKLMRMYGATHAALVLADRLNHDYEELKKQRSQLDFEDLITRTADLLTKSGVGRGSTTSSIGVSIISSSTRRRIPARSSGASSSRSPKISSPAKAPDRSCARFLPSATKSSRSIPSRARGLSVFQRRATGRGGACPTAGRAFPPYGCRCRSARPPTCSRPSTTFSRHPTTRAVLARSASRLCIVPAASDIPALSTSGRWSRRKRL